MFLPFTGQGPISAILPKWEEIADNKFSCQIKKADPHSASTKILGNLPHRGAI